MQMGLGEGRPGFLGADEVGRTGGQAMRWLWGLWAHSDSPFYQVKLS